MTAAVHELHSYRAQLLFVPQTNTENRRRKKAGKRMIDRERKKDA